MHVEKMKKQKELPEISRPSDANKYTSQITHGNANANSNPLALKLAAKPQL